jgi:hypothetical protein
VSRTQETLSLALEAAPQGERKSGADHLSETVPLQPDTTSNNQVRLLATCSMLRLLVVAAAIVTAVFALSLWMIAIIPAIVMAILYGLLVFFNLRARRTLVSRADRTALPAQLKPPQSRGATDAEHAVSPRSLLIAEEKAGLKMASGIFGSLAIIAIILASIFLGWRLVAIGGLVIFCYMALLGAPYWLAAIEEDVEQTREDLTGEYRSIH